MKQAKKVTRELLVANRCGVHARVSVLLAKKANEFASKITFHKGSYSADCRSVLDLLSLGAFQGDLLTVEVDGIDADDAMNAIVMLFDARFYEDDVDN